MAILVSQMMMRGRGSLERARRVEGRDQGVDVVAVDPLDVPAERLATSAASGSKPSTWVDGPSACMVVDVDDADQVVELPVAGADIAASQVEPSSSSPSENRL